MESAAGTDDEHSEACFAGLDASDGRPARPRVVALPGGLQVGEGLEDLVVVRLGRGLRDDVADAAVGVDDERRALGAQVRLAVHRLLHPHAVELADGVIGIGEQREVQVLLVVELLDLLDRIGRDADDLHAGGRVLGLAIADRAGLRRAARRVGLGVEVQDDRAAAQGRQADGLAVLVGQLEVRCGCAWADHWKHVRSCVASNAVSPAHWRTPGQV